MVLERFYDGNIMMVLEYVYDGAGSNFMWKRRKSGLEFILWPGWESFVERSRRILLSVR